MAKYTIELDALLRTGYDIGLKDYPIPSFADEAWRRHLNHKIINHYRYREIGNTAPDRWKLYLNNTMNEIMPIKNLMYEALDTNWKFNTGSDFSEVIEENSKLNSAATGKTSANATGNSSSNGYSLQVNSDTPGQLLNVESEIEANTYASSASKTKALQAETRNPTPQLAVNRVVTLQANVALLELREVLHTVLMLLCIKNILKQSTMSIWKLSTCLNPVS